MKNTINWFEIPVANLPRAVGFYSAMLDMPLELAEHGEQKMALFHTPGTNGALVQAVDYIPSDKGTIVYFDGGEDLNPALSRAKSAGAQVVKEKFSIGEYGFIAYLLDTEGNRIALHSVH